MDTFDPNRRRVLAGLAAMGSLPALPMTAFAADRLVATTFGGTWAEVHKKILAPYFEKKTGATVSQAVMLATEQVAKMTAAKGGPAPFDVSILDEGPALQAVDAGLIAVYDTTKSPNYADLLPAFKDKYGPAITMQAIGIAYNPKTVKTPPTSWDDLWDPKYKGRVGITSLASTLGTAFLIDINRLEGGNEGSMDPAFKKLKSLLPNLAAVSPNFGAHAALFQQGEIDLGVQNFNFTQTLKSKGVPVEFVRLKTGMAAWKTSMHVVKNAVKPGLAHAYIDGHLAPEIQTAMQKPPYNVIPTNGKVAMDGLVKTDIAATPEDLKKMVFFDWKKINEGRAEWTQKFNREIRL